MFLTLYRAFTGEKIEIIFTKENFLVLNFAAWLNFIFLSPSVKWSVFNNNWTE